MEEDMDTVKEVVEGRTKEIELLIFQIDKKNYGINVDQVKEIIRNEEITMIPNSHPHIEGIFMPREVIITLINLAKVLNLPQSENFNNDMLIITNFNQLTISIYQSQNSSQIKSYTF